MTARELKRQTRKELAALARDRGIRGWHEMKKRELVTALIDVQKNGRDGSSRGDGLEGGPQRSTWSGGPRIRHAAGPVPQEAARASGPDQLTVRWLGCGWIGLTWSLSARTVELARSALGLDWRRCSYALRLIQFEAADGSGDIPRVISEEPLDGAVDRWFLRAESVRGRFAVHLGFATPGSGPGSSCKGRFYTVLRSGAIDFGPGRPQSADTADADSSASVRFGRSLPGRYRRTPAASGPAGFELKLSAEVLLEGRVTPGSRLKCLDETVEVDQHGEFHVCVPLPDGRQVIHLEAVTPDGAEQRTTVFAVERNTKQLEPRPLSEPDSEDAFE